MNISLRGGGCLWVLGILLRRLGVGGQGRQRLSRDWTNDCITSTSLLTGSLHYYARID